MRSLARRCAPWLVLALLLTVPAFAEAKGAKKHDMPPGLARQRAAEPAPEPGPVAEGVHAVAPYASAKNDLRHAPGDAPLAEAPAAAPLLLPEAQPSASASAVLPAAEGRAPWLLPLIGLVGAGAAGTLLHQARARHEPRAPAREVASGGLDATLRRAGEAAARGDYEAAARGFDHALALAPRLAMAHACLGACLGGLGRHEEARESLRVAVELEPEVADHRIPLARACMRLGEPEEAMEALAPVFAAMPELLPALRDDEALRALADHPGFLQRIGAL